MRVQGCRPLIDVFFVPKTLHNFGNELISEGAEKDVLLRIVAKPAFGYWISAVDYRFARFVPAPTRISKWNGGNAAEPHLALLPTLAEYKKPAS